MINFINSIDPFVLAFLIGLVILLMFTRERLDAPIRSSIAAGSDEGDNTVRTTDAVFVHRLPPSSVRVARFFWVACAVYFLGLAIILAVLCTLLAAGLDNLVPKQGGLVQDQSAVPQIGLPDVGATQYPFLNSILNYLDRKSTISEHPWQPVLLALGLVGLLPSLPFIRTVEGRVRLIALRVAGIPSQVIKLWDALRETPVPDKGDELRQDIEQSLEAAVTSFREFTDAGQSQIHDFTDKLTKLLYYRAWISNGSFPERSVRQLIRSEAPSDLDTNVRYTLEELDHLTSLSNVVRAVTPSAHAVAADATAPGFAEARIAGFGAANGTVSHDDLNQARNVINERWQALYGKLKGEDSKDAVGLADYCCLMVAVYSERSNILRSASTEGDTFAALRSWIIQSREKMRRTSIPVNFAFFIAAMALILVLIAHYVCVEMNYISISDYSTSLRASLTFSVGVLFTLVSALLPVYWIREVLDDEAHWQPWVDIFKPPFLQYVAFAMGALVIGTLLHFVFIFLEPRIEGLPSRIQLEDMISGNTLQMSLLLALPSTALATFLCLAHDQRERSRGIKLWSSILVVLSVAFLFLALVCHEDYAVLATGEAWRTASEEMSSGVIRAWCQALMVIIACVLLQVMIFVNLLRNEDKT